MLAALKKTVKKIIPGKYQPQMKRLGDIVYKYLWVFYLGSRFTCPFCGKRFRQFLPMELDDLDAPKYRLIGHGRRDHCYCPGCFCLDRERLVYLYLLNRTDIFKKNISLLHMAPEEYLAKVFQASPNINYLSADLSMDAVMVKMDVTAIQYDNNTFDVIVCNHVLQYVPDDLKAMAELFRVLQPGGWAVLQVPISLALDQTQDLPESQGLKAPGCEYDPALHTRIYARDYQERLERAGFQVEKFRWTDHLEDFGGRENRYALIPEEILYVASKPGILR